MSNKETLQSHNERIQSMIDTANSLPDAVASVTVHSGSGTPIDTLGSDNDIYLEV